MLKCIPDSFLSSRKFHSVNSSSHSVNGDIAIQCETQLLEFQADILQNLKRGLQSDVLIMDFSKAFDKVGHRHLAEKLDFYRHT